MNGQARAAAGLDVLRRAVGTIGDDQLGYRTPCRGYDVSALAGHLVDSVTRISAAAGIDVSDPVDRTIARMVDVARDAVAGWAHRGTGGDVPFAGRTLAARDLLGVIALEFVVHGWDFATAVDVELSVADDLAGDLLLLARRTVTDESRRNAGFDEPVAIGSHGSPLDRLLAYTGRDPMNRTALR